MFYHWEIWNKTRLDNELAYSTGQAKKKRRRPVFSYSTA